MASSVPTERLQEQAARWAARALDGDMSVETARDFAAWMAADRQHRGAYLRARAALYALEDAVVAQREKIDPTSEAWFRPRMLNATVRVALGSALVASLAVAGAFGIVRLLPSPSKAPPRQHASRDVALADGSVVTMSDAAKIEFALHDGVRELRLLRGEAVFQVAKDRAHPFVVQSGDVYAQATGTVYSVRRIGETGGAVRVDEGSVLVWARDDREQAVLLHAGGALTLDPGLRPVNKAAPRVVRPAPPPPELAHIALDDVTIDAAAARFNRINRTRILVDPSIGAIRIVGLFRANDPERFARAAAAIADAQVVLNKDTIAIKMK